MEEYFVIRTKPLQTALILFGCFFASAFIAGICSKFTDLRGFVIIPYLLCMTLAWGLFRRFGREKIFIRISEDGILTVTGPNTDSSGIEHDIKHIERVYSVHQIGPLFNNRSAKMNFCIALKSGHIDSFEFNDSLMVNQDEICQKLNKRIHNKAYWPL